MLEQARPRFGPNGVWTIGAAHTPSIGESGRSSLLHVLNEFKKTGGYLVILIAAETQEQVRTAFDVATKTVGLQLVMVADSKEAPGIPRPHKARPKAP
jgi:hypothetical protein